MALVGEGLRGRITVLGDVLLLQAWPRPCTPVLLSHPRGPQSFHPNHFPGPEAAQVWGGDSEAHASQCSQGLGVLQGSQRQGLTLGPGDLTLGCPGSQGLCLCLLPPPHPAAETSKRLSPTTPAHTVLPRHKF